MARIAYFVHGRGSGHASRARTILVDLRARGHQVEICAGGDALRLLRAETQIRAVDSVVTGLAGLSTALRRVREDQRFLSRRRIDVVVTDGDAPGLHAARYERIPCVAIGHGLLFNNAEVGRLPLVPKVYERFNAASSCWLAQRKVAVHFLHGVSNDRNTVIARPNLTHLPGPALTGVRPFVVAYFRDRNGFRVMSQALAQGLDVRYFGASEDAPTGALVQSFCSDGFLRAMRGCSGVLTSSGSNVLSEAIALGKPILACFRKNDHEQRMNAILVDRARLGRALCLDRELVTTTNDFIQGMQERRFARYELHSMLPSVNECVVRACEELAGLGPEVGVSASVAHVA